MFSEVTSSMVSCTEFQNGCILGQDHQMWSIDLSDVSQHQHLLGNVLENL